jgi:hypothetical protein
MKRKHNGSSCEQSSPHSPASLNGNAIRGIPILSRGRVKASEIIRCSILKREFSLQNKIFSVIEYGFYCIYFCTINVRKWARCLWRRKEFFARRVWTYIAGRRNEKPGDRRAFPSE